MGSATHSYYKPPPTLRAFHRCDAFIRGVMGPLGSGKSSSMVHEILMRAQQQVKGPDGIRHSRWAVVRNTVPELKSTTIKTWLDWVKPDERGLAPIKYDPPISQNLRFGDVELEVIFIGLDNDDDIKKLKSLELTGIWLNEATEITLEIYRMAKGRVDRFPAKKDGGPTWAGVCMDYNAPDSDHWIYILAEEEKPNNAAFFKQPSALIEDPAGPISSAGGRKRYSVNPHADNLENLSSRYYPNTAEGTEANWISVFLVNNYGFIQSGRPVHEGYNDKVHFADAELPVYRGMPLLIGMDFGLTPAAAFVQFTTKGQLRIIDEIPGEGGIDSFINERFEPHIALYYPDMKIHGWGDPQGVERAATDERTCFQALKEKGFNIIPAPIAGNSFAARKLALDGYLNRMIGGEPGLLVSSKCKMIRAGLAGKYRFARVRMAGESGVFRDKPVKNPYSHLCDALQYAAIGIQGGKSSKEDDQKSAATRAYAASLSGGNMGSTNVAGY